jgi:undecaprenyl-diphosphatase
LLSERRLMDVWLKALVLGIVEGATEFLPISSTGHLIIAADWLAYPEAERATFEIFIQLGAMLAVFWHFRADLADLARRAPRDRAAQRLLVNLAIAFVPAAAVGFLFHDWIETYLFSVRSVAFAMIAGGVVIWLIEARHRRPTVAHMPEMQWREALWVGLAQVTSLYPGVSRAGATIMGGMLAGLGRPAATQFSFFLAMPTLAAASLFSLAKALPRITSGEVAALGVGLVSAFVTALAVIRVFLRYVQTHDFRPFAYYRIAFGLVLLLLA